MILAYLAVAALVGATLWLIVGGVMDGPPARDAPTVRWTPDDRSTDVQAQPAPR